jgi:hypothetical protein
VTVIVCAGEGVDRCVTGEGKAIARACDDHVTQHGGSQALVFPDSRRPLRMLIVRQPLVISASA